MATQVGTGYKVVSRLIVFGMLAGGIALVVLWATADDAPVWWLIVAIVLLVLSIPTVLVGIRTWTMSPEDRERRVAELAARRAELGRPVERSRLAHRATKHHKEVLRSGVPASAVVTFVADGGRANEHRSLVYLELLVQVEGGDPYEVQSGEYLTAASAGVVEPGAALVVKVDPADPQRVSVDWEESLRLR